MGQSIKQLKYALKIALDKISANIYATACIFAQRKIKFKEFMGDKDDANLFFRFASWNTEKISPNLVDFWTFSTGAGPF